MKKIEPVQFDWKKDGKADYGFIAQQFYKEMDFLQPAHQYFGEEEPKNEDGTERFYSLEYFKMTAILWKAVQELNDKFEQLEMHQKKHF